MKSMLYPGSAVRGARTQMNLRLAHLIIAAVREIATAHKLINSQELMARLNLPPRRLEAYLQALVRAGIIGAERGPRGGYFLKRPPSELTVADVLIAADPGYTIPAIPALAKQIATVVGEALSRVILSDLFAHAEENGSKAFAVAAPYEQKSPEIAHPNEVREDVLTGVAT
jgi:predicted transcriptional regulator